MIRGSFKLPNGMIFPYELKVGDKVIAVKPPIPKTDIDEISPKWYPAMDATNFQLHTISSIHIIKILDVLYYKIGVKENCYEYCVDWLIPKAIIIENIVLISHIFNTNKSYDLPAPPEMPIKKQGFTLLKKQELSIWNEETYCG